ncbi:MAG: hypothetical protein KDA92_22010 [Planctomycetales bacterium]|nr:hypothetical protein [Planctomycetales bacterium]
MFASRNNRRAQSRKPNLKVEQLEKREVFCSSMSLSGSALSIQGDFLADNIAIVDNGDGDLRVTCDGATSIYENITQLNVRSNDGADRVTYFQQGNRTRNMDLNVWLAGGNDYFLASVGGDVNAYRTLDIYVNGGNQNDSIYVSASNDVDVRSGGVLKLDLDGGSGADTVWINHRGEVDGTIRMKASGGSDNDRLVARFTADAGSTGSLIGRDNRGPALLEGNSGDDQMDFRVYKRSTDPFAVDALLDGSDNWFLDGGNDTGYHTSNVRASGLERNFVI